MGMSAVDYHNYLNGSGRTHPLWVAPFAQRGILNSVHGESELSSSLRACTYCFLALITDAM